MVAGRGWEKHTAKELRHTVGRQEVDGSGREDAQDESLGDGGSGLREWSGGRLSWSLSRPVSLTSADRGDKWGERRCGRDGDFFIAMGTSRSAYSAQKIFFFGDEGGLIDAGDEFFGGGFLVVGAKEGGVEGLPARFALVVG